MGQIPQPNYFGRFPVERLGDSYSSVVHGLVHCMVLRSRFRLRCEVMDSAWSSSFSCESLYLFPRDRAASDSEVLCLYFGDWSFLSPMLFLRLRGGDCVDIYFSSPADKNRDRGYELWFSGSICSPEFDLDNVIRRFDGKLGRWRFWSLDTLCLLAIFVFYLLLGCYSFVVDLGWQCWLFWVLGGVIGGVWVLFFGLRRLWYG